MLEKFKNKFPSYDPLKARDFLLNELIPDLKGAIIRAENSGMNLNEYFKQVINPSLGI